MLDTHTHILDSDEKIQSFLETLQIADNIWQDVADGKMSAEQASEIITAILEGEQE
jgi:hypothetical protein